MTLFTKSHVEQAYLKMGIMGFAGSGKTYTASSIAIGLVELMRKNKLDAAKKPVFFLDTETGSDWVKPRFDDAKIELYVAKTRAFSDLLLAIQEAEKRGSVLIIDSISHFWKELTETYARKKNRKTGLQFQDWAWLKQRWGEFTDLYVNSQAHIIMCGRAGYEYDFFKNDDGKKELEKTGVKMRAEGETGYEPSILVLMDKQQDQETHRITRTATVMKDRSTKIDGKTFTNPNFKDFLPHIKYLNLGGEHVGVHTERTSDHLFKDEGGYEWKHVEQQRQIALDEILEVLKKHYPSSSAADKQARQKLLEDTADTISWKRIEETYRLEQLMEIRNKLWIALEGRPYEFQPQPAEAVQ